MFKGQGTPKSVSCVETPITGAKNARKGGKGRMSAVAGEENQSGLVSSTMMTGRGMNQIALRVTQQRLTLVISTNWQTS